MESLLFPIIILAVTLIGGGILLLFLKTSKKTPQTDADSAAMQTAQQFVNVKDIRDKYLYTRKETGEMIVIPSREDSYERLLEAEKQFAEEAEDVEDVAVRAVMLEKLNEALHTLTDEETAIIHALFYKEISEVELAKKLGIARTTLQSRKYKILEKLRKLL